MPPSTLPPRSFHGRQAERQQLEQVERVGIAPRIDATLRRELTAQGALTQDLNDLTAGLAA